MNKADKAITRKLLFLIAAAILFLFLSSTFANALGITPSKTIIPFNSGEKISIEFDIINNGREELNVILYTRGEFSDSAKINAPSFRMSASEETKKALLEIQLPERIDTAGEHELELVAVGQSVIEGDAKSAVRADIAVISNIIIEVPYPEKYAEARIYAAEIQSGEQIVLSIPVFNKGSKKIESAKIDATIYSSDGTKMEEMQSDEVGINPGKNNKFVLTSANPYKSGDYIAEAKVIYDGQIINIKKEFSIGTKSLEIKGLVVDQFTLGQVANLNILLQNSWNTEFKNVYAEIRITGADGKDYTEFKTVAIDLPPGEIKTLEGYWYTEGVMPGLYTADVTVYYANKAKQSVFELEVYPNRIITRNMPTGQAISPQEESEMKNSLLYIFIILMLCIIISVLVYRLNSQSKYVVRKPFNKEASDQADSGRAVPERNPVQSTISADNYLSKEKEGANG